jgi:hypothetical protein
MSLMRFNRMVPEDEANSMYLIFIQVGSSRTKNSVVVSMAFSVKHIQPVRNFQ